MLWEIDPASVLELDKLTDTDSFVLSFTVKVSASPEDDVVAVFLERVRPIAVSGVGSSVFADPPSPHEDNNIIEIMYKLFLFNVFSYLIFYLFSTQSLKYILFYNLFFQFLQ